MKTGRNVPCPCGSGKKFKKCCIVLMQPQLAPQISTVEFNKSTAYMGGVGRERKQWCEEFISWKVAQLNRIVSGQKELADASEKRISCSNGCCFCCSQHIGASLQECEAIVYWLYQHNNVRNDFLARYSIWRANVRQHENIFNEVNKAASMSMSQHLDTRAPHEFLMKAEEYLKLDIQCPFLDNGSCSIYPVRPFVCASVVAVSLPESCKPSNDVVPELLMGAPLPENSPLYFRGPKESLIFSPAPLLVHEILKGGFVYLNSLPGLNGLEAESFGDPEVRTITQRLK